MRPGDPGQERRLRPRDEAGLHDHPNDDQDDGGGPGSPHGVARSVRDGDLDDPRQHETERDDCARRENQSHNVACAPAGLLDEVLVRDLDPECLRPDSVTDVGEREAVPNPAQ